MTHTGSFAGVCNSGEAVRVCSVCSDGLWDTTPCDNAEDDDGHDNDADVAAVENVGVADAEKGQRLVGRKMD